MTGFKPHSSHWGAFSGRYQDGKLEIRPHPDDPDPSPLLGNIPAIAESPVRIWRPAIRRGWLERSPGHAERRGNDEYVEVSWPEAIELVGEELQRVYGQHGPSAVFGGSYGWASAGRFHHAQSQIHRFLNVLGGYVRSINTYSSGAAMVVIPHVLGPYDSFDRKSVTWDGIERSTEVLVAFGGMAIKNADVHGGGISKHVVRQKLAGAKARGARFVSISPLRDDFPSELDAQWLPIEPGTDVALMLGLAHVLVSEGLNDWDFLHRYTVGYERFEGYLFGRSDGVPKTAEWATGICGIGTDVIRELARTMARSRTLITVSHSLQRADYGEQPVWMGIVLAAMLGQIGLDGGGYSYSLGALGNIGKRQLAVPLPTLDQFTNPVGDFIPCARVADMLLNPGKQLHYNGQSLHYPDIRLVYWAGGNPFHHHQDLNRLRAAFRRPETIIVHESAWTSTARHADIVLPATTTIERDDIGAADRDDLMILAKARRLRKTGRRGNGSPCFSRRPARRWKKADMRHPASKTSGKWGSFVFPCDRMRATRLTRSATIPQPPHCRRPPERSRSFRRRSSASAMMTAAVIRAGIRRDPMAIRFTRCNWSATSRIIVCTASSILAI
jgi:biotin/methionine sulfoxide reductase